MSDSPVLESGTGVVSPVVRSTIGPSFLLVVLSGAVGGMVYWVLQAATGIAPFGFRWYGSVPAALLVGGVAAVLGVYLLANSDTTSRAQLIHTLSFALVCGITWSTVIAGAKQQVISATGVARADTAQDKAASLQNALKNGNRTEVSAKVSDTAAAAAQAVQSLPSTTDDQRESKDNG